MRYTIGLILILVIATTLPAQVLKETDPPGLIKKPYFGISAFAAFHPKFPCDRWVTMMKNVNMPAMSVLWGTFGSDRSCVRRVLALWVEKDHLLEIHLTNEAGRRNHRLKKGELFRNDSVREYNTRLCIMAKSTKKRIKRRLNKILIFVNQSKSERTTLVLSLGLESQFSMCALVALRNTVREIWPYALAWNPVGLAANPYTEAVLTELHGVRPPLFRKCIANLDGVSIDTSGTDPYRPRVSPRDFREYLHRYCHCKVVLGWTNRGQGIVGDGRFRNPRSREYLITHRDVAILGRILERTNSDTFC